MNLTDKKETYLLLQIIKVSFGLKPNEFPDIGREEVEAIEQIASRQSILPVVYVGIKSIYGKELMTDYLRTCESRAIYDYLQRRESLRRVTSVFDELEISYIPLKGSVLRDLYPEPWMRTSSDVDILVHDYEIEIATKAIEENTDFVKFDRGFHDVHFKNSRVHLELHFNLLDDVESIDKVLVQAWSYATPDGSGSRYVFTPEYHLFYIIAHACKHFLDGGGVGIRPLLDIWLLKTKTEHNEEEVKELCEKAGILGFYETCCNLLSVWFYDAQHTELTKTFENLIMSGGVFGSKYSMILYKSRESKKGYIKSRVFIPVSRLKGAYPECQKHPILIPFYQMKRWTHLFKRSKRKAIKAELRNARAIENKEKQEYEWLLRGMGL